MVPLSNFQRMRVLGRLLVPDSMPATPLGRSQAQDADQYGQGLLDEINLTAGLDDNGAKTVETGVWTLVAVSALFLSLRLHCKRINPASRLRWEDGVLVASWFVLLANAVITTVLTLNGVGSPGFALTPENVDSIILMCLCSFTTGVVAQAWSKTSFAMTLLRMTNGWWHLSIWFAIVSINALFGVSATLFWVGCDPIEKRWKPLEQGTCDGGSVDRAATFGMVVSIYSGAVDIVLSILPWPILFGLAKDGPASSHFTKKEKIGVALAMSMGIFAGIAAMIKAFYMTSLYHPSLDLGDNIGKFTTWAAAETAVTIIASSVPVLRVLIRNVAQKEVRTLGLAASRASSMLKRRSAAAAATTTAAAKVAKAPRSPPPYNAASWMSLLEPPSPTVGRTYRGPVVPMPSFHTTQPSVSRDARPALRTKQQQQQQGVKRPHERRRYPRANSAGSMAQLGLLRSDSFSSNSTGEVSGLPQSNLGDTRDVEDWESLPAGVFGRRGDWGGGLENPRRAQ